MIFDLDGTLTDPKVGILRCIDYALSKHSLPRLDEAKDHEWLIGPPLRDDFRKLLGERSQDSLIEQLVSSYRERYETIGIFENSLYPGIPELLGSLRQSNNNDVDFLNRKLCLATSKPLVYAKIILDHFKLSNYFDILIGAELDGRRSTKEELIRAVIEHYGEVEDLSKYVIIGDRSHDILGARKVGIASIGVLYGYGSETEIRNSHPSFVVRSVQELGKLLNAET